MDKGVKKAIVGKTHGPNEPNQKSRFLVTAFLPKFSLRDCLWLTLVMALCYGWSIDRTDLQSLVDSQKTRLEAHAVQEVKERALREQQKRELVSRVLVL